MVPWEGAADMYRDWYRDGGILSNKFMEAWFPRQVLAIQHGNASAPKDYWMNESSSGPAALSREELDANYCDTLANARAREMDDGWYRRRSPDWSKVITPFLSAGSWAGFGLHPRGNFEAFTQAAAQEKWLEGHPGRHEEWFYLKYGMSCKSASSTIISRTFRTVGKKNHGYGSTCVGLLATSLNRERRMNGR
jgi:predicted acyl esterase